MNDPLNIIRHTKTGLAEEIIAIRGRSGRRARAHRTMLENLRLDQLATIRDALLSQIDERSLPTTCEECDRIGWQTTQPLHGVEGRSLCWTHAQQAVSKP